MKIGIKKSIDNLGRVVIPKEYREFYRLGENINIIPTEKGVLLRNPNCKIEKISNADN